MIKLFEIEDRKTSRDPFIVLNDLLHCLTQEYENLFWGVLELDVLALREGGDNEKIYLMKLQRDIELGREIMFTWQQLDIFSNPFVQIDWLTIVGAKERALIPRSIREEIYLNSEVVLRRFDGVAWHIYCSDEKVITNLKKHFPNIQNIQEENGEITRI